MAEKVYMVTLKILKEDFPIDDNIEDKYVEPLIITCQRLVINALLGDDKYAEIINQIKTNTLTVQNKTILDDYITYIIGYYVLSKVRFNTAYKVKNQNIADGQPNNDRFNELINSSKDDMRTSESFQLRLKDYICDNSISTTSEGKQNTLKTGLFLGNTKNVRYYNHNYHDRRDD